MSGNPNNRPPIPEMPAGIPNFTHDDGTKCLYRPYWVGNPRDGHWEFAYWYLDTNNQREPWRYCGEHN